mmetsp:Transcript_111794/g.310723  ORF Transcript_111794/g.310723 Transcript_111794/m.310723 type:complete len:100 (-) Transcript_111794:75-374(-)
MVDFELAGSFCVAHDNGVDGGSNDAEQDTRKSKSDDQSNDKASETSAISEIESCQQVLIRGCGGPTNDPGQEAHAQRDHKEDSITQVVSNDNRPSFVLE